MKANNTAGCDDGDACTTSDTCAAGGCVGGAPPNCDDGNVCTDDSCDPASGCVNANNTAACDDGDACTTADTCSAGACVGASLSCDDGNVCTDDSCDPASGCVNADNTVACDDGDACTTSDTCAAGACVGGAPPNCDNGLFCDGAETCDSLSGCVVGTDPCPGQACDEIGDMCVASNAVTVCSTLGDDPQSGLDQDVWTFDGVSGANVSVMLEAQDPNNQGRANLILIQDGGGLSITDHTDLPNDISTALPADGTYIVVVSQQNQDDLLPGNPFSGDYCVTVDAQFGVTLTPDASVEP